MRTKIDWYIHRATLGLPTQERVDTAAELRVHLNSRTKELMLEGHTKEEAEYLAVDAMGAVYVTNQQLLGHWFTPQRGWAALALVVFGCTAWFGIKTYLEQSVFQKPSAELADLSYVIGDTQVVEINIPKGAQSKFIAVYDPKIGQYMFSHGNLDSGSGTNGSITKIRIAITSKASGDCKKQLLHIKTQDFVGNQPTWGYATRLNLSCNLDFNEVTTYNFTSLVQPGQQVMLGQWQPIFKFSPTFSISKTKNTETFASRYSNISTDTVMQVYFSRTRVKNDFYTDYSPPPFWNFATNNLVYTSEPSYTEGSMSAFNPPKNTKTMRAVVFQNGKRYKGVRLRINDKKRIQIYANTSPCFPSCGPDANLTNFNINPGSASLDSHFFDSEQPTSTFPNDIGAYVLALPLPKKFQLEQWYPIYVLPTHDKTDDLPTHITGKPNDWFVLMVHFSDKASPETTKLPKPPDMPTRFRLREPFRINSLEIAQKPIPSSKPEGTAAQKP